MFNSWKAECLPNKKKYQKLLISSTLSRVEGGARTHDIQNHNLTL